MGSFSSKIRVVPYNESSFYVGNTNNNELINGDGKFIDNDGNCYMGKFYDGKFNGYGTMQFKDNPFYDVYPIYYKGNWKDNCKEGYGELDFSDGSKYIGNFHLDEIHGKGKYIYLDGSYYEGEFVGGEQVGYGKLVSVDGIIIYKGQWLKNTYHGPGKYYYDNGKIMYKGNWSYGECHGLGVMYHEDGTKNYKAIFENGQVVENLEDFNTVIEVIDCENNIPNTLDPSPINISSNNDIPSYPNLPGSIDNVPPPTTIRGIVADNAVPPPVYDKVSFVPKPSAPLRLPKPSAPPQLPKPVNSGIFNNRNTVKELVRQNPLCRNNNSKKEFINPLLIKVSNKKQITPNNKNSSYVVTHNPFNL